MRRVDGLAVNQHWNRHIQALIVLVDGVRDIRDVLVRMNGDRPLTGRGLHRLRFLDEGVLGEQERIYRRRRRQERDKQQQSTRFHRTSHRARTGSHAGFGSRMVNMEPRPTSLWTPRWAPCNSAICFAMVRPSPVPPASLDRTWSARQNRSKTCGRSSGADPGARIGDRDRHFRRASGALDGHPAPGGRVLERVVDQYQQQPPQLRLVRTDGQRFRWLFQAHADVFRCSHRGRLFGKVAQERPRIQDLQGGRRLARVAPGQQQQVVDERRRALRLAQDLLHAVHQILAAPLAAQRVLGGRVDQGHRRPQLVRGIGGELPGTRERLLDPLEHLIERLGELLQLVP